MATKKKARGMTTYTYYNWTTHDPILDWFDTLKKDSGKSDKEIAERSKAHISTIKNWAKRKTKSPKLTTMAACARALDADMLPLTAETRKTYRPGKGD